MSDYTKKLAKVAGAVLADGEVLLAGVRGMSKGSTKGTIGGSAGAVLGGAAGAVLGSRLGASERTDGATAAASAGLPTLPPQIAVGLTDRRLLVFRRSAITGAAKELVGELDRSRIRAVQGDVSGSKLTPDRLSIQLHDAPALEFEVVTGDRVEAFADAFTDGG